jgi:hypothetical protein
VSHKSLFPGLQFLRLSSLAILASLLSCCALAQGQSGIYQRTFPNSIADVKAALQTLKATSKGRLPTLDGFVQQGDQLDRYDKGYYDCTFQISEAPGGGTLVQAIAKVTAWFTAADTAQSGYRVLASNGRLENDALDRIEEQLASGKSNGGSARPLANPSPNTSVSNGDLRRFAQPSSTSAVVAGTSAAPPSTMPNARASGDGTTTIPPGETAESVKERRAADEKKSQELSAYIKNLEEIQRNQSHPSDLAAVKKAQTPIYAKPAETAQVLMTADSQDEFQILGIDGNWVHVQISGASRGWIRRAQLEMPAGFAQAGDLTEPGTNNSTTFKVAREETGPFSGNWAALKGKVVRIEWVEPTNPALATSQKEKLAFAKSAFLRAYNKLGASQPEPQGIVVVFDSADGGQIAASLSSVKGLATRAISDAGFWRQCSLDPPESFLDTAKP